MTATGDFAIRLVEGKEEADEVSRIALATGSEEDEIEEMMRNDRVYIAKRRSKIIGFIALKTTKGRNVAEITGLATTEDMRRKGVATLLIKHAEKTVQSMNAKRLIIVTSNDNIPALALYQKSGFKISEVRLGTMVQHHRGKEVAGWQGIPVRDEIILEKVM
jgi:ribosomal protein S18 acetylase RimI-like enzyme